MIHSTPTTNDPTHDPTQDLPTSQIAWAARDARRRVLRELRLAATLPAIGFAVVRGAIWLVAEHRADGSELLPSLPAALLIAMVGLLVVQLSGPRAAARAVRKLATEARGLDVEVHDAEEALVRAGRDLDRATAWREVARRLVHEIRNPLTPVQLAADELLRAVEQDDVDLPQVVRGAAAAILRSSDQALSLIRRFSTLAQDRPVQREFVLLDELVQDFVQSYRAAGVAVDLNVAPGEPRTYGAAVDVVSIRQVLANLIQNARDAGASQILVSVHPAHARDCVHVDVEDDGPGIPDDAILRVFDPYFTTKADRGGTGLGLAIAHQILLDHDGRIGVDVSGSRLGGARFQIEIPAQARSRGARGTATEGRQHGA